MNFLPVKIEEAEGQLTARIARTLALMIPDDRQARYRPLVGRDKLIFGLRPEHITEDQAQQGNACAHFDVTIDVTEPVGAETFVYFLIDETQVCGRLRQGTGVREGQQMRLAADLNHMQIIDSQTGLVA